MVVTGLNLNILDNKLIGQTRTVPEMKKTNTKAYDFGQKKALPITEKYTCTIETDLKNTTTEFYSIKEASDNLLCYRTAVDLGIVPMIKSVSSDVEYINISQCSQDSEN
jgi:hypothetical protein